MPNKPPLMDLHIPTADRGFYSGFAKSVAIPSKILVSALIVWAITVPENAAAVLNALNGAMLKSFASWYIWVVALFLILCVVLALVPSTGRLKLGLPDDRPEFSRFSWFSMMFGAGIGIGMLTFATAEPMYHFATNPNVIMGQTSGSAADNVTAAYVWSFLHWGFSAWACYALVGLSLAYFSYRRNLPLTVRSALTPLFGARLSGPVGHVVDIVAVVATILGVAQTLGFGVEQFVAGLNRVGFGDWILMDDGKPSSAGVVVALVVILGASTLSALSGVGKGIKWLSNLNMGLSFFLLAFFVLFGSTFFGLGALFSGLMAYLLELPQLLFTVWHADGTETGDALAAWQGGWSVFYWAWWIAFAPFVGVFLARISRGRSIREYVLGAIIVPSLMCFVWFTLVGGTAIDMTLNGTAGDAISGAGQESQLFVMLDLMLSDGFAVAMAAIVVVLLLTYLVTTADSAILIVNTINAAGEESPKGRAHIIFWGVALSLVVGGLLLVGGLDAIKTAMVIGALPFSLVMFLMCVALTKAVIKDAIRERNGVQSLHVKT
ncbi:BCCT family transporter [Mameliella sediminis]|uniref:BCCT family transporter n=1 Tax=Mameliella sediminis TaxID=2836866 RepID=UPI001C4847F7|nr:BCCT family transporter [Mameliella sediminis]MBV7396868.1 BCCT family transporter [Mameliella sediminis]MBY6116174.1 BCCT family transporter [Antarctobacter heliothermus]MBY6146139.1 BCCT family transporter [Mameliella alba]MCA0955324.1 BCCT family transporter [Mameliella alba]